MNSPNLKVQLRCCFPVRCYSWCMAGMGSSGWSKCEDDAVVVCDCLRMCLNHKKTKQRGQILKFNIIESCVFKTHIWHSTWNLDGHRIFMAFSWSFEFFFRILDLSSYPCHATYFPNRCKPLPRVTNHIQHEDFLRVLPKTPPQLPSERKESVQAKFRMTSFQVQFLLQKTG